MTRALIVFAKKPEVEKVKTRLVPPLTFDEAKELYICFLKDALVQYCKLASDMKFKIFLMITPDNAVGYFTEFMKTIPEINDLKSNINIFAQKGANLGEKIVNAFDTVFSEKYTQSIVIGTDHPTLPAEYIARAFDEMDQSKTDCVIGPTEDGGYYLLGLKTIQKDYFTGVAWSTENTFTQTLENLVNKKKAVQLLPMWYDVDDYTALNKMRDELAQEKSIHIPLYSKQFLSQMKTVEV
ncbi:TIGR04282 family arsenosugar biosynthesis glycosyltransferase [bacterium]|nr:TIGR04282 family arsenosugar biosynthesis glycosyltransferase [bacterium]